MNVDVYGPVLI